MQGSCDHLRRSAEVFSEVARADALVVENASLVHMQEEYAMARSALSREHELNLQLLSRLFLACGDDDVVSLQDVSDKSDEESFVEPPSQPVNLSGVPPLWSRPPVATGAVPDRVTIIVNPMTSSGYAHTIEALATATRRLKEHVPGIVVTVAMSRWQGHEKDLAMTSLDRTILILGGLGTTREVLNGVMARPDHALMQLAILPIGTSPSFSVEEGIDLVVAGEVREMDVLLVEELHEGEMDVLAGEQEEVPDLERCYCFTWGCWGSAGEALHMYNKKLKVLGTSGLRLAGITGLIKNRWYRAHLEFVRGELPDDMHDRFADANDYTSVTFFNHRWAAAHCLAPRAQLDDGLLDLHIVGAGSRTELLKYADLATFRSSDWLDATQPCPSRSPLMDLDYLQVSSMKVWPTQKINSSSSWEARMGGGYVGVETVNVDSDVVAGSPFRVSVVPRAIRIFASSDFRM